MFEASTYAPSPPRPPTRKFASLRGLDIPAKGTSGIHARLTLDPNPGYCGGEVGGYVDLAIPYKQGDKFRVSLLCVLTYEDDDAGWLESGYGVSQAGLLGTCVKFRFTVPATERGSGPIINKPKPALSLGIPPSAAKWILRVYPPGAAKPWEWEIPVEDLPSWRRNVDAPEVRCAAVSDVYETGKAGAAPIVDGSLRRRPHPDQLILIESAMDSALAIILWSGIGLVMAGAGWFAGGGGLIVATLGALILGVNVHSMGKSDEFIIMRGRLELRRYWYGLTIQHRTVPASRITRLDIKPAIALDERHAFWMLSAVLNDGSRAWLMSTRESTHGYVLRRWIALVLEQGARGAQLEGELPLNQFLRSR